MDAPVRVRVRVRGTVQGVGFRPFVYRLAIEEGLGGYVLNDVEGVLFEVEGAAGAIDRLLSRLRSETPPLARIEEVVSEAVAVLGGSRGGGGSRGSGAGGFEIRASVYSSEPITAITPDTATCPDCLAEVFDPADRRYRYPFTNCTNCGPRLTIVEGVPYDRALTTMREFELCPACRREYENPLDRRFHAQPNACPVCGPQLTLVDPDGATRPLGGARDPIAATAALLAAGQIVAVKGLGGYHLAVDATDEAAVARLRARKHREHKPLALMVRNLDTARRLVALDDIEAEAMASPACPIVLARRLGEAAGAAGVPRLTVAEAVAPGALELGVMLPYAPLHHLLLADFEAVAGRPAVLVMTSANISDEPIAYRDQDARERLASIADALLVHNREIRTRVDDSVLRVVEVPGRPAHDPPADRAAHSTQTLSASSAVQMLRRSRGYVPDSVALPLAASEPLLASGGELKSTFCLARGRRAWLSHHIGDLEHYGARLAYLDGVAHFEELLQIRPQVVVHDLHPDYASTQFAVGLADADPSVRLIGVQHHHAHLAAVAAEHGLDPDQTLVGAVYDGTGYGLDGTIWGGEILVGSQASFERVGALDEIVLPGGEAAVREPWRVACAWLEATLGEGAPLPGGLRGTFTAEQRRAVMQIARDGTLSPRTSSVGRLFDAAAALCGLAARASYEGQAAIEFTNLAGVGPSAAADRERYRVAVVDGGPGAAVRYRLDPRPALRELLDDLESGRGGGEIARAFHSAMASATAEVCGRVAAQRGLSGVVLGGGCFQNPRLLGECAGLLSARGLQVLTASRLPPGDGGLSFGQAAIAARMLA